MPPVLRISLDEEEELARVYDDLLRELERVVRLAGALARDDASERRAA